MVTNSPEELFETPVVKGPLDAASVEVVVLVYRAKEPSLWEVKPEEAVLRIAEAVGVVNDVVSKMVLPSVYDSVVVSVPLEAETTVPDVGAVDANVLKIDFDEGYVVLLLRSGAEEPSAPDVLAPDEETVEKVCEYGMLLTPDERDVSIPPEMVDGADSGVE